MLHDAVPAGPSHANAGRWEPKELGLPKATALSLLLVGLIGALFLFAETILVPHPVAPAVQVMQAQLVQLPTPTPPPPPKVIPPPKPLPAVIPKPPPVQSKIAVATKPPPPVPVVRPPPHPVVQHQPVKQVAKPVPQQVPQAATPAPPAATAAPAPNTSGEPIYGAHMHDILQANQDVPPALKALGASGTAYVEITVAPDGHVVTARISKSSGNPLIDQTALDHALHANFGAFNAGMPDSAVPFTIPVEIDAEDDADGGDDGN